MRLIALFFWLVAPAFASPFLVSDLYPTSVTQPTSFLIEGLPGGNVTVKATVNADLGVQLVYDLGKVPNGTYALKVTALFKGSASIPTTIAYQVNLPSPTPAPAPGAPGLHFTSPLLPTVP